jgi:hypothetical protein
VLCRGLVVISCLFTAVSAKNHSVFGIPATGGPDAAVIVSRDSGAAYPALALEQQRTHIVWASRGTVFYRPYDAEGEPKEARETVTGARYAVLPTIAVRAGTPCVAWTIGAVPGHDGFIRVNCRRGGGWGTSVDLDRGNFDENLTTIFATPGQASTYAVVYGSVHGLFMKRSLDGQRWSQRQLITRRVVRGLAVTAEPRSFICAFISNGVVYVSRSIERGTSWRQPVAIPLPARAVKLALGTGGGSPVMFIASGGSIFMTRPLADRRGWERASRLADVEDVSLLTAAAATPQFFAVAWIRGQARGSPPTGLALEALYGRFSEPSVSQRRVVSRPGDGPNWAAGQGAGRTICLVYASRRRGLIKLERFEYGLP